MFVPRPSVKKLVLRSSGADTTGLSVTEAPEVSQDPVEDSLTVGLHENLQPPMRPAETTRRRSSPVDESFVVLNPRKKPVAEELEQLDSSLSSPVTSKKLGSAGVSLTKAGYYTLPILADLTLDSEGQCLVTGFTVGR